jgi:hypothetical protein
MGDLITDIAKGPHQEKIRHAAAATDMIPEGCNRALQALQAPLVYNAAGVLADPSTEQ